MTLSSLFFGANAILSPLITLSLVISTYFIGICIFRLWFSPLAKFPGPRLAALTGWTETYYEILHGDGGQFSKVYARWHEIYGKYRGPNLIVFVVMLKYTSLPGPIIRIKPDELHIQDASFFETLYVRSGSLDKLQSLENRFNNPSALLNTPKHSIHRIRRKALDPFFTRRKITEYVPTISEMLERICERIEKDFLVCSRILLIQEMWGCFSTEVIVNYCFGLSKQFIEAPDFRSAFHGAMMDIEDQVHIMTQFPILYRVMNLLPDRLIVWMQPKMSSMIDFNNVKTILAKSNYLRCRLTNHFIHRKWQIRFREQSTLQDMGCLSRRKVKTFSSPSLRLNCRPMSSYPSVYKMNALGLSVLESKL